MAQYKVPQDVEADDKLVGPFAFRQFIYLLIALACGAGAYFICAGIGINNPVSWIVILLTIPVCGFMILLAIPRKDQPMETYIAALIKFYFKPHLRTWRSDGTQDMIEISVPVVDDSPKTKDFDADEAVRRLSFLSEVEDTQGRSAHSAINNNLNEDFVASTTNVTDVLSQNDSLGQELEDKLVESERKAHQDVLELMRYNEDHSPIESPDEVTLPTPPEPALEPIAPAAPPKPPAPEPTPVPAPAAPKKPVPDLLPEEPEVEPEPKIPPKPAKPVVEKLKKPAIIEGSNAKTAKTPAEVEEVIGHEGADDSGEVEIDLH
ncbi:PrgI family protein [Candidatus Saccharibacteria bacterium]|nr:PrgI family protein [Candidatus Saccharibacteria bacterium]MCL1963162.1 PrgI family protein [Candidatus Saccharibacteria bacterium]